MKTSALLAISLAALAISTALPARRSPNPAACRHPQGVYDICDTEHSFVRCNGHEAILVADCKLDASSYCQVVDGRGRCDGETAPDLSNEVPSCEANPAAAPSASGELTRGK
ncbi:hypothetical protein F4860DRAFT_513534 [Xylaria cubensis]|nr:hypothetical protein F4860DRAFT_513534 [Xylaria cubensis]